MKRRARRILTGAIIAVGLAAIIVASVDGVATAGRGRHSPRTVRYSRSARYASMLPSAKAHSASVLGPSQLQEIATSVSAGAGESHPSNVKAVETTYGQALSMVYGSVPPNTLNTAANVYVITMTGHFTAYHALIPPGVPLPTGTQQMLIVDLNGNTLDSWLNDNPQPALAQAGPVMQLSNPPATPPSAS